MSSEAAGGDEDLEHVSFILMRAEDTFDGQDRVMSRAAWDLQCRATAHSARCGHPGFVPDEYLDVLRTETTITAAELCTSGMWERVSVRSDCHSVSYFHPGGWSRRVKI